MYMLVCSIRYNKTSLKITKGYSETVNGRRTDNTMVTNKKGQKDKQRSNKHYTEK